MLGRVVVVLGRGFRAGSEADKRSTSAGKSENSEEVTGGFTTDSGLKRLRLLLLIVGRAL